MAESRIVPAKMREIKPPTQEEINTYLSDQKITNTHKGIVSRANEGKFQQSTNISKMDTKESIPVVLRFLFHIQRTLQDELGKSESQDLVTQTLGVVHGAICTFHETVVTLNLGPGKKLAYLRALDSEQTIMELEHLVSEIRKITVTPATEKLWDEVALWMDGIYRRTADKIKKGPKPCYFATVPESSQAFDASALAIKRSHAAYVRAGDTLWYVDNERNVVTEIKISKDKMQQFEQIVVGDRCYTDHELQRIAKITGHEHPKIIVPLRNADGSFPRVDLLEDGVLYKATNYKLTKMEISLYYHQAASTIANLLEHFKVKKVAVPARPIAKPIVLPDVKPAVKPVAILVAKPVVAPVIKKVTDPVVEKVVEPAVEKVVGPVVEKIADPIVEKVVVPPAMEPVAELDDALQ